MKRVIAWLAREHRYANPTEVGYLSWLTLAGRTVAFRALDGALVLHW